eukprot:COSAG02_NODE_948_length_15709_cov_67.728700_8_plen_104_part_00
MCLLCIGNDKAIHHFNTFLLPEGPPASAPGTAAAPVAAAPRQAQQSLRALPQPSPTPLQAFTTAAVMGLAKGDRTPGEQRALMTTATTLSGLAAASATTPQKK